jgi:hypothetical protein
MKNYEAIATTKDGITVSIATCVASSLEEARRILSIFLWATSSAAEVREVGN